MKRIVFLVVFVFMAGALFGCGSKKENLSELTSAPAPMRQDVRVKVTDVSNKTGEVFDVDAIGLLWSGLEDSLKNKGLLWTQGSSARTLMLEAQIVQYKKGHLAMRLIPFAGETVLSVKCDLKSDGQVVASAESKHTMSIGSGGLTFGAWRKIFAEVSRDLVDQLSRKI